jgi:hypothetical protein
MRIEKDLGSDSFQPDFSQRRMTAGRMAQTNQGNIRYTLKAPYGDGTTHHPVPLDFMYRMYGMRGRRELRSGHGQVGCPGAQTSGSREVIPGQFSANAVF